MRREAARQWRYLDGSGQLRGPFSPRRGHEPGRHYGMLATNEVHGRWSSGRSGDPSVAVPGSDSAQQSDTGDTDIASSPAEIFEAHLQAMEDLADRTWDLLSGSQLAALAELEIDRRGWSLRFGQHLFSMDLEASPAPLTLRDAQLRGLTFPREGLDNLVDGYVRRLHGEVRAEGVDKMGQAALDFAYLDRLWQSQPGEKPLDDPVWQALHEPLHTDRDDSTPFDGFIDRLWPKGDEVVVGPFRLAGGLELAALIIIVIVLWIPLTLASTWRLIVFRRPTAWLLSKAAIGWLVAIAVIGGLIRSQ